MDLISDRQSLGLDTPERNRKFTLGGHKPGAQEFIRMRLEVKAAGDTVALEDLNNIRDRLESLLGERFDGYPDPDSVELTYWALWNAGDNPLPMTVIKIAYLKGGLEVQRQGEYRSAEVILVSDAFEPWCQNAVSWRNNYVTRAAATIGEHPIDGNTEASEYFDARVFPYRGNRVVRLDDVNANIQKAVIPKDERPVLYLPHRLNNGEQGERFSQSYLWTYPELNLSNANTNPTNLTYEGVLPEIARS